MAPSVPLVTALFTAARAHVDESSMLQMPVKNQGVVVDEDECRCPGYFEAECTAEAAQGCVWSSQGSSNGPWCQCLGDAVPVPITPVTLPPVTLPPVTLPPVTAPPVTLAPVTLAPVPEPVEEQPLWSQHMEDSAKCNSNVDMQYVASQIGCQQIAVAAGHPYYSFRHNANDEGHKCMSSQTCLDEIQTDTTNEWNMYVDPDYQPPQVETPDVDVTESSPVTCIIDQVTEAVPRPAGEAVLLSGNAQCPDCTCETSAPDPHWSNSGCHSMFDDDLRWGGGPGFHLQNDASFTITFPLPELIDHVVLQQIQNHGNNYWRGDFDIETFNNGVWTVRAHVNDLSVQELPLEGDGRFMFQFAQPVIASKVRMSGGNPQNGNGEIFRLEELQVYGYDVTESLSPSTELVDQTSGVVPRPPGAVELLSGNTQCPDCTCEVSAPDPHWSNSVCQSMFDDDLRWGGGPGLHLQNDASLTVTFPGTVLIERVDLQQIQNHGNNYWRGDFDIETFNDGVWTVRAHVDDLPVQDLPMIGDGRNSFQFAQPVMASQVRMSAGNPQNGNGEIFRLEELQVYGWATVEETGVSPVTCMVEQVIEAVARPAGETALLSGNAHCPDCTCETSAPDPHWGNSGCQSMFDDDLRWGGGPGFHLQNDASFSVTLPSPVLIDLVVLQQIQNHGSNYWRGDFDIETFNNGVWTVRAHVDDLSVQQLPMEGDGRFTFQFAQPVMASQVRMNGGNPQNGNGEIFRLEELQVYGWPGTVTRPAEDVELLTGTAQCSDCTCETSAPDPHWSNSGCQSMFDDDLRWGGGPGFHLQNDASFSVTFPAPKLIDHIDLQQIQNHGSNYWRGDFDIETFHDGAWTVQAHVDDLSVQELPIVGDGRFTFQFAQPIRASQVRMSGGNPQNGNGEIFRLEELQVYGWPTE